MQPKRSHFSGGKAYYKTTGPYTEFTKSAIGGLKNDSTASRKQKSLVISGDNSGSARTTKKLKFQLGI